MREKKSLGTAACFFLYLMFYLYIINQYRANYNAQELQLYWTLVASYTICGFLVVLAKYKHNLYLFEPFTFASLWYLAIFIYKPFSDLANNNLSDNGVFVLAGGAKATVFFTVGYMCFYLGYYGKFKLGNKTRKLESTSNKVPYEIKGGQKNSNTAIIGWAFSFVMCIISMLSQGISLRYIFSLAASGERVIDDSNVGLLFLTNFGVTLVTYWMMILVRPGKPITKVIITVLSIIYLIMRNGRWLLMVFAVAPVVFYYIKRKRRPNLFFLIGSGFVLLIIFAWMQYNRANIMFGKTMVGLGDNWLTLEILLSPFNSDLSTYKVFFNMVTRFPAEHPYMFGTTFLYVFILFVPRALWAGKPDNPVRDMIEYSMNNLARRSGTAVANIGEFYANFGLLGIAVLMFAFGKIISQLKKLYQEPTEERLIAYSVLFPLLFQWVARGNFSGNFYMTIFAMLPFIIEWFIHRVHRRA